LHTFESGYDELRFSEWEAFRARFESHRLFLEQSASDDHVTVFVESRAAAVVYAAFLNETSNGRGRGGGMGCSGVSDQMVRRGSYNLNASLSTIAPANPGIYIGSLGVGSWLRLMVQ
jgi:hypothetical protein